MRPAVHPELDEGALVDQQLDALTGGQLLLRVLSGDLLSPTAELYPLASGAQVLGEGPQQARGWGIGGHEGYLSFIESRKWDVLLLTFAGARPRRQAERDI